MPPRGGLSALLSRDFEEMFGQMVSIRVKTLSNTNLAALRHIKIEKGFLPVDMHHSLIPTKFVWYLV